MRVGEGNISNQVPTLYRGSLFHTECIICVAPSRNYEGGKHKQTSPYNIEDIYSILNAFVSVGDNMVVCLLAGVSIRQLRGRKTKANKSQHYIIEDKTQQQHYIDIEALYSILNAFVLVGGNMVAM